MGPYDDILGLERPVSRKHVPMPRVDRAKQFMPFAALRGFDDEIDDRGTLRDRRKTLSEDEREAMDVCVRELTKQVERGVRPTVILTVFTPDLSRPDAGNEWGSYAKVTGAADRIRSVEREIRVDGQWYSLDRIDGIVLLPQ